MSLEEAIQANTAAVLALTAALGKSSASTPLQVANSAPVGKSIPAPVVPQAEPEDDLTGDEDAVDYVALRAECKDKLKEVLATGEEGKEAAKAVLAKVKAKNIAEIPDEKLAQVTASFQKILDA